MSAEPVEEPGTVSNVDLTIACKLDRRGPDPRGLCGKYQNLWGMDLSGQVSRRSFWSWSL